jgi:uncharacterized RDD family membrane protein YckC
MREARRGDRQAEARDVALGFVLVCGRVGVRAGRFALLPARVVVRSPLIGSVLGRTGESLAAEGRSARARGLGQLEASAGKMLASPEVGRTIDHGLAGPLPETVARSLVERRVVERVVEQVLASADLEAAIEAALEHAATERLVQETLASPGFERIATNAADSLLASSLTEHVVDSAEMQRLVEEIASSPAVRAALLRQTTTLGDEVAAGLRRRMERLDDAGERTVQGWSRRRVRPQPSVRGLPSGYGGLGARGLAFTVDLAISALAFLAAAALVGLVAWLTGGLGPGLLAGLLASAGWVIVLAAYLVLFWTVAGQTPGMRLMRLRVTDRGGAPLRFWRALARLIGLVLAIIPVFAGFLPVLFDQRRRALQDFLAGTVVRIEDARLPTGEPVPREGAHSDNPLPARTSPESPGQTG